MTQNWLGLNPPYPIYFNPTFSIEEKQVFIESSPIESWKCEFIQLDSQAEQLGIFSIYSERKKIFVVLSGEEKVRKFYKTLFKTYPSERGAEEDIRLFEMIRPISFNQSFNLFNFCDCCSELKNLAKTLLQCYDEIDETLNVIGESHQFEEVINKIISQYLSLMTPSKKELHKLFSNID